MPLFGPPDVERLKARRDTKGLIKALQYGKHIKYSLLRPEPWERAAGIRKAAAAALGDIGDPVAVDALISAVNADGAEQDNAVVALGSIRDARAVDCLTRILASPEHGWKGEWHTRLNAALALVQIGSPLGLPLVIRAKLEFLVGELAGLGAVAVDPLITELLNNPDTDVREYAGTVLAKIRDPRAMPALVKALQDPSHAARRGAAKALSAIGYSPKTDTERAIYARRGRIGRARQRWERRSLSHCYLPSIQEAATTPVAGRLSLSAAPAIPAP
jgi:HEAT repeat protein